MTAENTTECTGSALGTPDEVAPSVEASPAKRGPGKPRGLPKSGGRQRGTPNRNTAQTRERIAKEADPLGLLMKVANGKRFEAAAEPGDMSRTFVFPTLEQRIAAAQTLARKLLPDLRATELTGLPARDERTDQELLIRVRYLSRELGVPIDGTVIEPKQLNGRD